MNNALNKHALQIRLYEIASQPCKHAVQLLSPIMLDDHESHSKAKDSKEVRAIFRSRLSSGP
jgi:hypothetical protein